eukprot:CAMPEP_0172783390 /NCGR_PEP_ID=MMETSP1074-20121228/204413_1 /TAXON_ID=2916 /ORGANISM="Ceratium fusus, Strain PA161109" /LENGTH=320 /DNA_ID=CAMNT_0013620379 /DNA_START=76 /DNA_END=1038 /DNA_ORIENTATION=+
MINGFSRNGHDFPAQFYQESPTTYGALGGFPEKTCFARRPRRRTTIMAMGLALFVPCIIFTAVFAVMSFEVHWKTPRVAFAICGFVFFVVLATGYLAVDSMHSGVQDGVGTNWYTFTFLSGFLAWSLGMTAGGANFARNMQPFYDVYNLNSYPAVDPTQVRGQQLMDAGRMVFKPGSQLDLRYSMAFRNVDVYCVAPVTTSNNATLANYDFWAVGLNCCHGEGRDFHCGDFSNPHAHAGLRLMKDNLRPFFRLAVQQAEAAYNIKAMHPVFLYWLQDPVLEMKTYQEEGYKYCTLGIFYHFSLQLLLVVVAAMGFSKLDN